MAKSIDQEDKRVELAERIDVLLYEIEYLVEFHGLAEKDNEEVYILSKNYSKLCSMASELI